MEWSYYVYMMSNWKNNVLYIGITNNLLRRIREHKTRQSEGFTKKYNVTKLVYYEVTNDVSAAIMREKEIKKWRREKKNSLVNRMNPDWADLSKGLIE